MAKLLEAFSMIIFALVLMKQGHSFQLLTRQRKTPLSRTHLDDLSDSTRPSLRVKVADGLLTSLFKIKPLFNVAAGKARSMMKKRVTKEL